MLSQLIKSHPRPILRAEQARKIKVTLQTVVYSSKSALLQGIGAKTAAKLEEILKTGMYCSQDRSGLT